MILSGCTSLVTLSISSIELKTLNLSGCDALETLNCGGNLLSSLNLTGCIALKTLDCGGNALQSLDLSECNALTSLNCSGNLLTSLNLSHLTELESLNCDTNGLLFSTLILPGGFTNYTYGQQYLESYFTGISDGKIDLSSERIFGGNQTTYTWRMDKTGTIPANLYTNVNGVFTFDIQGLCRLMDAEMFAAPIYCVMTNVAFPGKTLTVTTYIKSHTYTPNTPDANGKIIVTDSNKIDNKVQTASGLKQASATETSVTIKWEPSASAAKKMLSTIGAIMVEIYAPNVVNPIGVITFDVGSFGNVVEAGTDLKGLTLSNHEMLYYKGFERGFKVTINGLNAGTKYTVKMQTIPYTSVSKQFSKITQTTITTKVYKAVTNDKMVTKQTVMGQVTLGWKDANNAPKASNYEVGFWVGKAAIFNRQDYDKLMNDSTVKQKDKDTAKAIWAEIGEWRDSTGLRVTAPTVTFYGITQKCTFAVRATATFGSASTVSAVAKIAVTPLKYPAPAKITQPTLGTMTFTWEAPALKNATLPSTSAPAGATVTYAIGVYDTQQKKFMGTVSANTYREGLTALTSTALSGVKAGDKVAVQQVITFANGKVVQSAVKVLTVK
jgi:hypothetical protein